MHWLNLEPIAAMDLAGHKWHRSNAELGTVIISSLGKVIDHRSKLL
jgi:hypothetical protein